MNHVGWVIATVATLVFTSASASAQDAATVARGQQGFVETATWLETEDLTLITGPGGTQPTLRYYDEADRNRTRGSLLLTVIPCDAVDVYVQFAGGKDEYLPDPSAPVSRPTELFGLQEQAVKSINTA
jgi:hypothetical protein